MKKWDQQRGRVVMIEDKPNSGRWCVQMPMERGQNHGGDAIKWFMPGADAVYARFYVKFSPDYQYNHHFVWLGANQRTNKWSAFGKAGLKPNGTYYSAGMEPWFVVGEFTGIRWRNDRDLKVNFFWLEHYGYDEGDPTKQYWKDSQSVWFDDVVVARRHIGPIQR